MKKILALSLAFAMMISVCACGSITEKDIEYVSGTVSNNVYTNTLAGIRFTPGPGWTFATDEEILEMMDIGEEYLSDEAQKLAEVTKQKVIFDMQSIDSSTGDNVVIQFENLALTIGGMSYNEEDYADATKKSLEGGEFEYTFGEYKTIEFCGEEYLVLDASTSYEGVSFNQKYLIRKIDSYMLCIIITSVEEIGVGTDAICDMFSAI